MATIGKDWKLNAIKRRQNRPGQGLKLGIDEARTRHRINAFMETLGIKHILSRNPRRISHDDRRHRYRGQDY